VASGVVRGLELHRPVLFLICVRGMANVIQQEQVSS